jgi:formylglycine-generating enzyme required for sulfatase activity
MKHLFFIVPLVLALSWYSNATAEQAYGGMKLIPAIGDSFVMGFNADSTQGPEAVQWGPYSCVMGEHLVKFTYSFYMDTTMVTQTDFQTLMGFNPSQHTGNGQYPVENLSWYDAALYCNARSKRDKLDTVYQFTSISKNGNDAVGLGNLVWTDLTKNGYRIPTNAEYEYATRAHTSGDWFFTPPTILGWTSALNNTIIADAQPYCWSSQSTTHAVATLKPNPFGLYDMRGNCFEWENDFEAPYPLTTQIDPVGAASGDPNEASCGNGGADAGSKMCCGGSYSDDVCNHERTQYHYHWDATTTTGGGGQISFRCAATVTATAIEGRANPASAFPWVSITPGRLSTQIFYTVQNRCRVSIAIFDCKGQTVRTIVSGALSAGTYATSWDGRNNLGRKVAAGSYLVSVTIAQRSFSKTLFMAN